MLPCTICEKLTQWLCADCRIDKKERIAICENPTCRDKHEASGVCAREFVERIKVTRQLWDY